MNADRLSARIGLHARRAALLTAMLCMVLSGCRGIDGGDNDGDRTITVFAAASTTDVIDRLADQFEAQTGITIVRNVAASSTLARQLQSGAQADVFLSANEAWMDAVQDDGLIDPASRLDLLGNRLVLIAPADDPFSLTFDGGDRLTEIIDGRLALGDPEYVPAGMYARQALQSLGWWEEIKDRIVAAVDVRSALAFVQRGEVRAGIVYRTDARVTDGVVVVAELPAGLHDPIRYPVALTASASPAAQRWIEFLRSDAAAQVFRAAGFEVIP